MICITIDELTTCLNDTVTGETIETEVIRIKRKSFLRKFNQKNGWYVNWEELATQKKYSGVGGHLLTIAIDKSEQYGYNGDVTGFCRSEQILQHFVQKHGAIALRMLHEYQIGIFDEAARSIREEYNYEWTEDEI
jgi:hypothetical protein